MGGRVMGSGREGTAAPTAAKWEGMMSGCHRADVALVVDIALPRETRWRAVCS